MYGSAFPVTVIRSTVIRLWSTRVTDATLSIASFGPPVDAAVDWKPLRLREIEAHLVFGHGVHDAIGHLLLLVEVLEVFGELVPNVRELLWNRTQPPLRIRERVRPRGARTHEPFTHGRVLGVPNLARHRLL